MCLFNKGIHINENVSKHIWLSYNYCDSIVCFIYEFTDKNSGIKP